MKKENPKKRSINAFNNSADSNSDEAFIKTRFAAVIRDIMVERGLKGNKAAETLDISKSEADALLKGKFSGFSLDRLLSLLSNYARNTYRAVYAINLGNRIYVLHCFQKKSRIGRKTPKKEIDLIRRRLNRAKELAQ